MFALKTKKEKIFESKERQETKLQSIDIQQLIFLAIALICKQKKTQQTNYFNLLIDLTFRKRSYHLATVSL